MEEPRPGGNGDGRCTTLFPEPETGKGETGWYLDRHALPSEAVSRMRKF